MAISGAAKSMFPQSRKASSSEQIGCLHYGRELVERVRSLSKLGTAAAIVLFVVLLFIWQGWAYQWGLTGFGDSFGKPKSPQGLRDYYPGKTLWDWMQLLLVPGVLAASAA